MLYRQPALGGRLHWASTETAAAEHAGHIEGALAAGERAARAVLNAATSESTVPRQTPTPITHR
ncbi:FAD-dependent oxidoreductase [Streptomyces sp. KM273126]|uniref:FAD-dependent oxidoreductase n=1 Tax=Streptomyces sp. KM273126 TaxID=2545247 RepID=UPI0037DA1D91